MSKPSLSHDEDFVELTMYYHTETKQSVLVSRTDNVNKAVWLSLSQIECHPIGKTGLRLVKVTMPDWLAESHGWLRARWK